LNVPKDFKYKTTSLVTVYAEFGSNFANIPVGIYGSEYASLPDPSEQAIEDSTAGMGTTDADGNLEIIVTVPLRCSYLVLEPDYLGLPSDIRTEIVYSETEGNLSGNADFTKSSSKAMASTSDLEAIFSDPITTTPKEEAGVSYIDTFDENGRPDSISSLALSQDFFGVVNDALLSFNANKSNDENFVTSLTEGTLDIETASDVWFTFIHARAGQSNTLGYYTYETANGRPETLTFEQIKVVFPNSSYQYGEEGALDSGDTLYIGNIAAGTSLGFVLISDGWNQETGNVDTEQQIIASEPELNSTLGTNVAYQRQLTSILYDEDDAVFLVGMEDTEHTFQDYNFSDLVYAVSVNALSSVSNKDIFPNVSDTSDTEDGEETSYATVENLTGTLAYEDMWPSLGDYDFNDLVVGYSYDIYNNESNQIVSIDMKYTLLASGAGYPDGLSIAIPLEAGDFTTSQWARSTYSGYESSAPESYGEDSRNILIFLDQEEIMGKGITKSINTDPDLGEYATQSVSFTIDFAEPVDRENMGEVPYDVFMIVDTFEEGVEREVHLPQYGPTDSCNLGLLNTEDDTYNAEEKRYYKAANNLPWALHIPGDWKYSIERESIADSYLHFGEWAESSGTEYTDWYLDKTDYQDKNLLY
jgi:LruC domain-containing protein